MPESPVRELRLALTVERYDEAVVFYRDVLGLPVIESFEGPGGGGVVLDAGRATLELLSVGQAELVDEVEVGSRVAGPVRVALEVADSAELARRLALVTEETGATPRPAPRSCGRVSAVALSSRISLWPRPSGAAGAHASASAWQG